MFKKGFLKHPALLLTTTNNISPVTTQVHLGEVLCGTIKYKGGTNPYHINCGTVTTPTVTIVGGSNNVGVLTLCEVEVYSRTPIGNTFFLFSF